MGEVVAAHSMLGLQMADDRLDSGAASQLAFDRFGHASSLPRDEHPKLMRRRRIVAAIAAVGDDARDARADLLLHLGKHSGERMAVVGIAGQGLHMRDELAALRAKKRRRHRHFDAELIGLVRLALADAFDLGRVQRIDLPAPPLPALLAHALDEMTR